MSYLSQVSLRLTSHLGHNLRAVDKEEEGASLIGDRPSDQRLARSRRAVEQHSFRRLDAQVFE